MVNKHIYNDIKSFCVSYIRKHGYPPAVREIVEALQVIDKYTIKEYLDYMLAEGDIETDVERGESRAFRLRDSKVNYDKVYYYTPPKDSADCEKRKLMITSRVKNPEKFDVSSADEILYNMLSMKTDFERAEYIKTLEFIGNGVIHGMLNKLHDKEIKHESSCDSSTSYTDSYSMR